EDIQNQFILRSKEDISSATHGTSLVDIVKRGIVVDGERERMMVSQRSVFKGSPSQPHVIGAATAAEE
ncbi:hypothetical protein SK128_007666, partial [Halocaridina rubra]